MENINEIKKALYREKPVAKKVDERNGIYAYDATLVDGTIIQFDVPISDMGDAKFEDQMDAKLLIRYIRGWTL